MSALTLLCKNWQANFGSFEPVQDKKEMGVWNEYVEQGRPLGYRRPFGNEYSDISLFPAVASVGFTCTRWFGISVPFYAVGLRQVGRWAEVSETSRVGERTTLSKGKAGWETAKEEQEERGAGGGGVP